MEGASAVRKVADLRPGDHLCCIYQTEEEHRALITPFLRHGLEKGEKVVYIVDARTAEEILGYLSDEGVGVSPYLESGQLSLLTVDDSYMRQGAFDPDSMIRLLAEETELALSQGYSALRVTGEMTWALRGLPGSEKLIEYEAKLNQLFPGSACLAICQYDRRHFSPDILLDVLTTHPIAVIGTEIYDNFYYISPDEYLGEKLPAAALEHRLSNLENRRRMEGYLRESEEKYRLIVDNAQEGIWTVDDACITTFVNQRMAEILGYSVREMMGASMFDFIDEERRAAAREYVERQLGGISETFEFEFTRKDGSHIFTSMSASPILNEKGQAIGATALVSDITERKRSEDELREIRDYLDSLIEYANAPIIVWDPSRVITRFNQAFEFLTGYSSDEVVGRDLAMLFPEPSRDESLARIAHTLSGEYWESVEIPIQRVDGEVRIALWNSANIYSADGTVLVATIAQGQDITARKQAEEALAWEVEVNRALAELSNALLAPGPIEDIAYMILESAKRLTASPFGYAGYIDTQTGYLVVPTFTGDIWETCAVEGKSVVFKDFTGLWGWVLLNREPLLTNAPGEDQRSSGTPPGHIPIKRFISAPALMGDTLVGQLSLANSGRDYTQRDIDLMNRLADLYAIAVLRMWSEGELERYREHLEELVRERTLDLERINRQLQEEIAERRRQEEELKSTAAQLRALSARLQSIREEERKSISLDVHDKLGQALTGLKMQLSLLGKRMPPEAGLGEDMAGVMELIDGTIQSVQEICTELRPGLLDDLGLIAALDWQLQQFEQQTGITSSFESPIDDTSLDKDLSTALFRISQEALTNVARHAGASRVHVRLDIQAMNLTLEVSDDGRGFLEGEAPAYGSLGILGMKERAYAMGGEVEINGELNRGTTLVARIPLQSSLGGGEKRR